jgi:hypothetical protein
MEKSIVS